MWSLFFFFTAPHKNQQHSNCSFNEPWLTHGEGELSPGVKGKMASSVIGQKVRTQYEFGRRRKAVALRVSGVQTKFPPKKLIVFLH